MLKCVILGCGASDGTPRIGCKCAVCTSKNPKNFRLRSSIFVESDNANILIDITPDFRTQALQNDINKVNAVFLTHAHADHISGLDDLRPIAFEQKSVLTTYMNEETWKSVNAGFGFLYEDRAIYAKILKNQIINDYDRILVGDLEVQAFKQYHGHITSLGFRIRNFAYSTDVITLPEESFAVLEGVDIWIVDCLRFFYSPSHSVYEQTMNWIDRVKPKIAILSHMTHQLDYNELASMLPSNIMPAYDGMVIDIEECKVL